MIYGLEKEEILGFEWIVVRFQHFQTFRRFRKGYTIRLPAFGHRQDVLGR